MSDRGIIFSAPMVRALLDGRKTQTRRLLALRHGSWASADAPTDAAWAPDSGFKPDKRAGHTWALHSPYLNGSRLLHGVCKVPYAPGDRLYVREAATFADDEGDKLDGMGSMIYYRADQNSADLEHAQRLGLKWRPSIHMFRTWSRMTLVVTDVRVQRLQEISAEDAIAEGIESGFAGWRDYRTDRGGDPARASTSCPINSYRSLWNTLHTKAGETWADNPWIVAVTFDVHQMNIDMMPL